MMRLHGKRWAFLLVVFAIVLLHSQSGFIPSTEAQGSPLTTHNDNDPAFADFEAWIQGHNNAATPEAREIRKPEGEKLAVLRKKAMAQLIDSDPRRALELAFTEGRKKNLPASVAKHLERRVSGKGDYEVLVTLPTPGSNEKSRVLRYVTVNGERFEARVYGRRLGQTTKHNIPLHGIALDGVLALNESPIRRLDPGEVPDPNAPVGNPDGRCPVSANLANTTITAEVGGTYYNFCGEEHIAAFGTTLAGAEGGSGPLTAPTAPTSWTDGPKTVLFMRVDFSDSPGDPVDEYGVPLTVAAAESLINGPVNSFYVETSYGKTSLTGTATPLLRMPQTLASYKASGDIGQLLTDARNAAAAVGYDTANFDRDIVGITYTANLGWGAGIAYVGGKGIWLMGYFNPGTAAHELGHNYGVFHANGWLTTDESSIIGPGSNNEYANLFDIMGGGSAPPSDFNAWFKTLLNWMVPSEVQTVTASGTYRIYALDDPISSGMHALTIQKDVDKNYWVEFRQHYTTNPNYMGYSVIPWIMNGVSINWGYNTNSASHLLDMTPGSVGPQPGWGWQAWMDLADSPLVIGRTFSDTESGIHITPVGKGGTVPESMDVVVNMGSFPGNQPPVLSGITGVATTQINTTVVFNAAASDPDGDSLAYYWEFGDRAFGTNSPTASHSWSVDGAYTVTCTVTDMKGKQSSSSVTISVFGPLPVAPTNLSAVSVIPTAITLSWTDNAAYESGFKIERGTDGVNFTQVDATGANLTIYTNYGLASSTRYYYRVRAYNFTGDSAYTNVASAMTLANQTPLTPGQPGGAPSVLQGASSVYTASTTDPDGNQVSYIFDWGDGTTYTTALYNSGAVVSANKAWSTAGTFSVRVQATDVWGAASGWSSPLLVTVAGAAPAAPSSLTATVVSNSQIDLTWTDNAVVEDGFRIERSSDNVAFAEIATVGANVTTFSDFGLAISTYYYRVRAYNATGNSSYSNTASATMPPIAPSGLVTTAVSSSQINLSWTDNATNEEWFFIERSADGISFYPLIMVGVDVTSFSDNNGLSPQTTSWYRIRAYNVGGYSSYTNIASATTFPLSPPAAPSGLTATAVSSTQIDLSWTDNSTDEVMFAVERSTDPNFTGGAILAFAGANATTFSSIDLIPGTTYYYRVRAYNGQYSAYSNTASATTPVPLPAAPSALTATAVSSSQINLSWTDNATNETGFKIERGTDGVNFSQIATVGTNSTTYNNSGLTASTTYYFRVRATNTGGDSGYSNVANATTQAPPPPPPAPSGLIATAASNTQINLSWMDNSSNETGFKVERGTDGVSFSQIATTGANSVTYNNTGLTAGTTYYYRVRATNANGDSAYSNTASATTTNATTVTFTSVGAQDGYVLESTETSNVGGSSSATSSNSTALRTGDDNQDKQYKAFVSFDTSSIPDGATITSVTVKLKRGSLSGTNPFTTHGTCYADIRGGTGFGGATALANGDFQAAADATQVATMSNAASNDTWSTGSLNATGRSFVNKTGTTQIRVYFNLDDNDDTGNDYIGWYSGENSTSANRPVLEVTYTQ